MLPIVFFFPLLGAFGDDVPAEVGVDEFPLLDNDPLRSLGDKLEFLLDDLEELGLETWLPFLDEVGPDIAEVDDCFEWFV